MSEIFCPWCIATQEGDMVSSVGFDLTCDQCGNLYTIEVITHYETRRVKATLEKTPETMADWKRAVDKIVNEVAAPPAKA